MILILNDERKANKNTQYNTEKAKHLAINASTNIEIAVRNSE